MTRYAANVEDEKAETWGVYHINDEGFHDWIADFTHKEDAQAFAGMKNGGIA